MFGNKKYRKKITFHDKKYKIISVRWFGIDNHFGFLLPFVASENHSSASSFSFSCSLPFFPSLFPFFRYCGFTDKYIYTSHYFFNIYPLDLSLWLLHSWRSKINRSCPTILTIFQSKIWYFPLLLVNWRAFIFFIGYALFFFFNKI